MEEIKIRKANLEDGAQVAALLEELGYPNKPAFIRLKIEVLDKGDKDTVLVSEMEGKILGVAHLHTAEMLHEAGHIGRIMAIGVKNEHQRSGIGRALMASLEIVAQEAGCARLEITSDVHHDGAHEFYKSLGYGEESKRFLKRLVQKQPSP